MTTTRRDLLKFGALAAAVSALPPMAAWAAQSSPVARAAKPLKSQAKFVWMPVGILNKASEAQGAALLAAKDPAAAMDEHEASMNAKQGGISATGDLDAQREIVKKNTALMNRFGFASIPTVVGLHAQTGALVSREGSMPTADLAALLGLQVPAAGS